MNPIPVFIETGKKKTFAGALEWPGWSRSGRDETAALQALLDRGPRYAQALHLQRIDVPLPAAVADFQVVERHPGSSTTDFGAPDAVLAADLLPVAPAEFVRLRKILCACWQAFGAAVEQARGRELRTGPRGGGRSLEKIIAHTLEADIAYLARLAWKYRPEASGEAMAELDRLHQAILDALDAAERGALPKKGPRGGKLWTVRFFVRREAWHTLDHAWEIEDRAF